LGLDEEEIMSMKKVLCFLMIFISCSKNEGEESNITQSIPPEEVEPITIPPDFDNDSIYSTARPKILNSYWTAFVKSAALYDVDLSNIEDVTFISEDLGGSTAGIANGSCEEFVLISVDETLFRNLTTGEQIFLMYHELGHDVFNASHDGGGLMAPNIRSLEYDLFQTEVKDFFTKVDFIEWTDEECEFIRGITDN
tara:strand:- start:103 stop:690 length:588 start_codon:yes stop_codon:yes gene_type:complete